MPADNIDDDTIVDFFKGCGELTGLRWMTRQGSEEFRGCGFVEFASTEEADKAIKLDGKELLGRCFLWLNKTTCLHMSSRPIRIDWTD